MTIAEMIEALKNCGEMCGMDTEVCINGDYGVEDATCRIKTGSMYIGDAETNTYIIIEAE